MTAETTTPTEARLLPIAKLFWPDVEETGEGSIERSSRIVDVLGSLYCAPIVLAGFGWLVATTAPSLIATQWPILLVFLALSVLLRRLMFVMFIEIRPGDRADLRGSLSGILSWSAALSFGPTALWVSVVSALSHHFSGRRPRSAALRWNRARNLLLELTEITAGLVGLTVFRHMGGTVLAPDAKSAFLIPAAVATAVRYALAQLLLAPFLLYWLKVLREGAPSYNLSRYLIAAVGLPLLIDPFAILVTVLYREAGLGMVLFFSSGLFLVSLLANRLSAAAMRSQQRARELEKLEELGRDIIGTPVDSSTLSDVLDAHVPVMLPTFQVDIRLFPDEIIYRHPEGRSLAPEEAWEWLHTAAEARCFLPGEALPWDDRGPDRERLTPQSLITAPILKPDAAEPIGGMVLTQQTRPVWDAEEMTRSLPAVQTLASQIGSALHGAERYRLEQELSLAGQIQASFLPNDLPIVPGWQLAASLRPARQTAGDFYDLIPLPNGRLGIVIADVADKGMGAALYMALSRTLLRTYALEYHTRPDFAMKVTNRRLLMDTDITMFVTVFYGVLDPRTGQLAYCNAGHNPPLLFHRGDPGTIETLTKTGMALGAMPGLSWRRSTVQIAPGDVLVLYTDGVTDAQSVSGAFFGKARLMDVAREHSGRPAHEIRDALLRAVEEFTGEASQFDDITLVITIRGK